jgi:protein-L-isoaspartate(D-aspartate) O-methyltransferase
MTAHSPIPDFAAARLAMVESQLRPQGVTDPRVLSAMRTVAREDFVPAEARAMAYADRAVPLGEGRSLAAPSVLGQLLTEMMPEPGMRALVVGAATGYSAAVLAAIGLDVVALESSATLAATARKNGVEAVEGPLEAGHKPRAPYDLILLDGAVEHIPDAIISQLADGGRLGAGLVERGIPRLIVGRKAGAGFGHLAIGDAGVPPLPGFNRPRAFAF